MLVDHNSETRVFVVLLNEGESLENTVLSLFPGKIYIYRLNRRFNCMDGEIFFEKKK